MSTDLGQPVVVENVAGAGGSLGAQRIAQARPDGYTILLHHIGMSTIPTLYRRLSYDPINGFETVGLVTEVPMTLVARRNFPANNLQEFVQVARRERERLNYANAGIGAASHLCGLLLQSALNTPFTTVPYRGTGPAMNDLVAGTVDIMCDQTTNTTEQIRAGTIRGFAVTLIDVQADTLAGSVAGILDEAAWDRGTKRTDPARALARLERDPAAIDVLITDQTMPRLTGQQLALAAMALRPDLPVLLVTGHSTAVDEAAALACGIRAFLRKPVDPERLLGAVNAALPARPDERQS
jgi:CheY-like chemotaxis protein